MVSIREAASVSAPIDEVLAIILDPAALAACLPAATLTPTNDNRHWQGVVSLEFDAGLVEFRCEFRIRPEDDNGAVVQVRGVHEGGEATISATASLIATSTTMPAATATAASAPAVGAAASPDDAPATLLEAGGQFVINGAIEHVPADANIAATLFEAFAENVLHRIDRQNDIASEDEADAPISPREQARRAAAEFLPEGPMVTRRPRPAGDQAKPFDLLVQIIKEFFGRLLSGKK